MKETRMMLMEDGELDYWWECEACKERFPDTRKFEKATECPGCGATITDRVGFDDEEF